MSVPLTELLREFCRVLSFANLSVLPNVFELFVDDEFPDPPKRFEQEKCSSTFLLEAGNVLTLVLV
jgi:hypothetical protein